MIMLAKLISWLTKSRFLCIVIIYNMARNLQLIRKGSAAIQFRYSIIITISILHHGWYMENRPYASQIWFSVWFITCRLQNKWLNLKAGRLKKIGSFHLIKHMEIRLHFNCVRNTILSGCQILDRVVTHQHGFIFCSTGGYPLGWQEFGKSK